LIFGRNFGPKPKSWNTSGNSGLGFLVQGDL
jgi:hypothetical protein